jgi:DNA-binding transcriptional LysR family regulator
MDWNDLRYLIAIAREGTLAGAARALGVQHTTVSRRLQALESDLGIKLLHRTPDRVALLPCAQEMLADAERMEQAALAIERRAAGDLRVEGTVRVTTSELMTAFLVKRLGALRARHPALTVEVISGNERLDLARGEADVAVRIAATTQPDLIVRKLGRCPWALYAAGSYVEARGRPASARALAGQDLIGFDETMKNVPGALWFEQHGAGAKIVFRGNSIVSALNGALVGLGVAALPFFVGDAEPTLVRVASEDVGNRDISLVYHPDVAKAARVRAVMDFLVEAFSETFGSL